jgi:ATP-dependent Clp protease ATP-binding subunit ClpC
MTVLSADFVLKTVSSASGLPEQVMSEDGYMEQICKVEDMLKERLVGQDEVITSICSDLANQQRQWFEQRRVEMDSLFFPTTSQRPRFSALLLGETGLGKTETAKIIAEVLFSGNEVILRGQDVGPNQPHASAAWNGSPPGYVGHGQGGALTNPLRKTPFNCIIFDEIEKASQQAIMEVLMGAMGEGRVTDKNDGSSLDTTQTMIFATSNVDVGLSRNSVVGFSSPHNQGLPLSEIRKVLVQYFPPELIARFNGIYFFKPLNSEDKWQVFMRCLEKNSPRKKKVQFTPDAEIFIRKQLGMLNSGARGVQDYYTTTILPLLYDDISGGIGESIDFENGQFVLKTLEPTELL